MPAITQKVEELLGVKPKESLVDMIKRQTDKLPAVIF
jgi:hypothetical protein